jgi:hypothetical protein
MAFLVFKNELQRCLEARSEDERAIPLWDSSREEALTSEKKHFHSMATSLSAHPLTAQRYYVQRRQLTYHVTRDTSLAAMLLFWPSSDRSVHSIHHNTGNKTQISVLTLQTLSQVLHRDYQKRYLRQTVLYVVAQHVLCSVSTTSTSTSAARSSSTPLFFEGESAPGARYLIVLVDDTTALHPRVNTTATTVEGTTPLTSVYSLAHAIHNVFERALLPTPPLRRPLLTFSKNILVSPLLSSAINKSASSSNNSRDRNEDNDSEQSGVALLEIRVVVVFASSASDENKQLIAPILFEFEQRLRSLPLLPSQQLVMKVHYHSFASCVQCRTAYLHALTTSTTTFVEPPHGHILTQLHFSLDAVVLRHFLRLYEAHLIASSAATGPQSNAAATFTYPVYIFVLDNNNAWEREEELSFNSNSGGGGNALETAIDLTNVRSFPELLVAVWTPPSISSSSSRFATTSTSSTSSTSEEERGGSERRQGRNVCNKRALNFTEQLVFALVREWWGVTNKHVVPSSWLFSELAAHSLYTHTLLYLILSPLDSLFFHLKVSNLHQHHTTHPHHSLRCCSFTHFTKPHT